MAQVIDARFSAVMGFEDEAASKQATTLIKKAVKEIEKQFPPSTVGAEGNGSSIGRRRAPFSAARSAMSC